VNRKLMVATNRTMASRLPRIDTLGHHGLTASNTAAATSNTPSRAENVLTEKMSYIQLISGLSDTRGSMPLASYSMNFSTPNQASTTTRP
jgi:hypothetical protein